MTEGKHVVRIRGLPWSATQDDIAEHFADCNLPLGKESVHLTFMKDGKPTGEAYLELASKKDADQAKTKDRSYMGKRYIEVFPSTPNEMDWVVRRSGPEQSSGDAIVRLRGLPFTCSKEEIANFFSGLEIEPNGISLIIDPRDPKGRGTGEAFVQFASPAIAGEAMLKNKQSMGHRYIEIFKSSFSEARNYLNQARMKAAGGGGGGGQGRPGPYDRMERFGGGSGGFGAGGGGGYGPRARRGGGNMKGGFYDDFDNGFGGGGSGGGGGGGYGGGGYGGGFGGGRRDMMGDGFGGGGYGMGGGGGFGSGGGGRMGGGGRGGGRGGGGGGGGGTPGESFQNSLTGHWVHMRGLPFTSTEDEITRFFRPIANPVKVEIHFENGRATGEADVDFASHEDAKTAMTKDRGEMKHRYIELFLHSSPGGGMSAGGGMGLGGYGGGMNDFSTGDGYGNQSGFSDMGGFGGGGMGRGGMGNIGGGMGRGFGGGGGGGSAGFGGNYTSFS